jgi:hypothetical protein
MFIIENGYLSFKFNDYFIKNYFYIENFSKEYVNNILSVLNSNVDDVIVVDNIKKNTITVKIKEKDYIIFKINEKNKCELYIFNITVECSKYKYNKN